MNLLGRRPVLDQLEYVGPQHHRSGRYRKISTHLELRHIDAGGEMRRAGDIAQETPPASHQVGAAGVDALLQHRRVRPGEVRRRQRVEDVARRKPCLALSAPVDPGIRDQAIRGVARGEVALHHPAQQPVLLPRSLAEATIALARTSLRAPGGHAGQLDAEATGVAPGASRMARQSRDRAPRRLRLQEPAHPAALERGIAQHHVEARLGGAPQTRLLSRAPLIRCRIRRDAHWTSRPWTISSLGVGIMPRIPWLMPSLR